MREVEDGELDRVLRRLHLAGRLPEQDRLTACLAIARGFLREHLGGGGYSPGLMITDAGQAFLKARRALEEGK